MVFDALKATASNSGRTDISRKIPIYANTFPYLEALLASKKTNEMQFMH